MKTFSSILILCLAFTFGNAQDVTVHAESDPAADFNNYKTFTIVDRDVASAQMNQDQNRGEGQVTGSGYGSQGATGATEQGTTNRDQQYGTTGDQNNTTDNQNNTSNQGTYGTTNDQNRTSTQGTQGTTGDQNNTDTQGTYGTTGDQNNTDTQGTYGTTGNENTNDQTMSDNDESMSTESDLNNNRSEGTMTDNQTNDNSTYNNNQNQNNTQSGTVGTTSDNQNNMGNNDRSQNQEYGTTNNQNTYGTSGNQNKYHADPSKKALKEAIKSEMESRGFTYTENNADLLVNYSVFDGEATVSTTGDQGRPGYTAWGPQIGENESQVELEDGSVVIHLVDAEKNQLVFTAFATGTAEEGSLKEDKVSEAVSKIFEEIPGSNR